MSSFRIPPVAVFAAAAGTQHLLARRTRPSILSVLAGGALTSAAAFVGADSLRRFHRDETTVDPLDPTRASALVQDGPFAISRNPMYVALASALTAHAITRRSWLGLLPVAGFVAVMDRYQIPPEEDALREAFGEDYEQYAARVPRWA